MCLVGLCGGNVWGPLVGARLCCFLLCIIIIMRVSRCLEFFKCIIIIMRVSRCLEFFCVFPFALWGGVLILGRRWCPTTMGWVRDGVCAMIFDDHAECKWGIA